MVYDPRKGIKAKQVYMSFTDAVRDSTGSISLTGTDFTGNAFDKFWGAYYGDLAGNSVVYSITDLGFDSTGSDITFQTNSYDVIASITTTVISLTTNTGMTPDAHIGKWVIIKKANGDKVFARIVDNAAGTITTDRDLSATKYGVAGADTIILLNVPFGLNMNSFFRLDHVATNFSLTAPEVSTDDTYFLGTADAAGSQNMTVDSSPPGKFSGSITIRGGVQDLARLKYNQDATIPTGKTRYNLGSDNTEEVGFTAIWATEVSDLDSTADVTKAVFCNDIIITKVGILDSVSSDGRAEATIEFEVKGANVRLEVYDNQSNSSGSNI